MAELKKTITTWQGIALAVSMVIGSGLLGLPGIALKQAGVNATAIGWIVTCVAAVPLIAIFSRLGLRYTSAAGLSLYAEKAAGPWAAYGVTVVMAGSFIVGIPALGLIGGAYAQRLVGAPAGTVVWLAIALLALVTVANIMGVRVAGMVNTASFVALVTLVVLLVVLKSAYLGEGLGAAWDGVVGERAVTYVGVWHACLLLFWAFIGWENMSFGLEEFRDPGRSIPRVYWWSFVLVVLLYLGLGFTTTGAQIAGVPVTGPSGLAALLRTTVVGDALLTMMVLVIIANANAWVFGASRSIYAAGRSGILPSYLGTLSPRSIPAASLVTMLAFYATMILATSFGGLSVERLILIVSQNLVVLYVFSIFAYWKTETRFVRWPVTILALFSCAFLLSAVGWWIVYPLALLVVGYVRYRRHVVAEPLGEGATAP